MARFTLSFLVALFVMLVILPFSVLAQTPSPTDTPTPTDTPSPTVTLTPTPTPTPFTLDASVDVAAITISSDVFKFFFALLSALLLARVIVAHLQNL
ncbi:MAG TPA: hypothetical protein VFD70_24475 [Anaerolineae bacterium]|nr:hypothetical protein [Anaerolineae bacterium]